MTSIDVAASIVVIVVFCHACRMVMYHLREWKVQREFEQAQEENYEGD